MGYSLGIGMTNECNLNCAHCYRDTDNISHISLVQIKRICETIPVDAMGMGTGENALNPEFVSIVSYLYNREIKLSIASNGYSLTTIPEENLLMFNDVEVSIDFPTQEEQDAFRGVGNWELVHQAIDRCQKLGVEVSNAFTVDPGGYSELVDNSDTSHIIPGGTLNTGQSNASVQVVGLNMKYIPSKDDISLFMVIVQGVSDDFDTQ